ncbi:HI_0552 family protein [Neisseria sp.]|uniref:HI_0552 family protein n=1 Tax=Neisseria sp. TaxID=192066 RepID=UPI0035A17888
MLTPASCGLFDLPFYQFAQLKKYRPDTIPQIKADYKHHWEIWRSLILGAAEQLGGPFAPPHIERWCNGWQVRAHFFAFFKYAQYQDAAAIISVLLNRKRLTVSLDWHCYKAAVSPIHLPEYNRWLDDLDARQFADFDIWHGAESEYGDYLPLKDRPSEYLTLQNADDFFCIGRHIDRDDLGRQDEMQWIVRTIQDLEPLYRACFA